MSDRPVIQPSSEPSRPIAGAGLAQAHPFTVDVDRRKRIDDYIDYFGNHALSSQLAAHPTLRESIGPKSNS